MEQVNGLQADVMDAKFEELDADQAQEPDPAASFLAREQEQLAGIAAELDYVNEMADTVQLDADHNRDFNSSPALSGRIDRQDKEEPEKIKKWREEQKIRLEQKDAEEEVKKQEMREAAKKELEDWYANHEEQISKTKAANRNAEKQFVAESDEMEPGTEWERIAKLCDFNPKSTKSSKDVSRMRSIILQLKQSGTVPKKG